MCVINIDWNNGSIEAKGHTFDPVVCHAVSGLFGGMGAFMAERYGAEIEEDDDAYFRIAQSVEIKATSFMYEEVFLALVYALKAIEEAHQGNIIFIETGKKHE